MMEVVWVFALGGAVLVWMGLPLWRRRARQEAGPGAAALNDLLSQKDNLLATARDLDFDLETDKLSPEDHRLLRERCQAEAVAVMERLETMAPPPAVPGAAVVEKAAPKEPSLTGATVEFCPRCGRKARPTHKFCAACGLPLSEGPEGESLEAGEPRKNIGE